jgi:hypothetical protein
MDCGIDFRKIEEFFFLQNGWYLADLGRPRVRSDSREKQTT